MLSKKKNQILNYLQIKIFVPCDEPHSHNLFKIHIVNTVFRLWYMKCDILNSTTDSTDPLIIICVAYLYYTNLSDANIL